MANKKQKKETTKKRRATLSSPTEIVADFIAGMSGDKEVIKGLSSLSESHFRKKIRGVVSTQSATLDAAIGRGGVPMSRITILHGKEGCIASGAMISVNRCGKGFSVPIEHVVEMFNGGVSGGRKWSEENPTMIRCMQPDGSIRLAKLTGAFYSGVKNVFEIKTFYGKSIMATRDHLFYAKDPSGKYNWTRLDKLNNNMYLATERMFPEKGDNKKSIVKEKLVGLKNHPFSNSKKSYSNRGGGYKIAFHRLVIEADINGMDVDSFISTVRSGNLDGLQFLDPKIFHVHHIDCNRNNNDISNLRLVTKSAHSRIHENDYIDKILVRIKQDRIVSIKEIGRRKTYDLSVDKCDEFGNQNFVANGIVVHNSGKTTLALHLVAEAQRRGGLGVYVDKEYKLDPDYVESLGVDAKRLFIPEGMKTLEDVIPQIKATLRRAREIRRKTKNPVPIVIVIDSLNACKAFETVETPTGKKRYPAEARIWSEELPGIVDLLSEEYVALVFISQVRKKMNVMFGNDEETSGGFAPKFFASLMIYINRIGTEKDSSKNKTGSKIETECRKNQISPPFKKANFVIYWNRGIDYEHSLVLQLESMGLVKKVGKTKKRKAGFVIGEKYIGKTHVKAAANIRENPKLRSRLIEILHKKMKWDSPI